MYLTFLLVQQKLSFITSRITRSSRFPTLSVSKLYAHSVAVKTQVNKRKVPGPPSGPELSPPFYCSPVPFALPLSSSSPQVRHTLDIFYRAASCDVQRVLSELLIGLGPFTSNITGASIGDRRYGQGEGGR
jgi:hypothetical protein